MSEARVKTHLLSRHRAAVVKHVQVLERFKTNIEAILDNNDEELRRRKSV